MQKIARVLLSIVIIALVAVGSFFTVLAEEWTIPDSELSLTYETRQTISRVGSGSRHSENGNTYATPSGNQMTLTAQSSTWYKSSGLIPRNYYAQAYKIEATLTNNTGKVLSVSYVVSGMDGGNGTTENRVLQPGETLGTFAVTATPEEEKDDTPRKKSGTITITSIKEVLDAKIFFASSPHGSYTYTVGDETVSVAAGAAISAEQSVALSSQIALNAGSPKPGYVFYGFMANGRLLGKSDCNIQVQEDATIYPVFLPSEMANAEGVIEDVYKVGNNYYLFWNDAVADAFASGNPVVLAKNHTLENDLAKNGLCNDFTSAMYTFAVNDTLQFVIPYGVTLLIPYDDANTLCTVKPSSDLDTGSVLGFTTYSARAWVTPTVYRKLTMSAGTSIAVDGAMSLSGRHTSQQKYNGMPTKATSFVVMNERSSITVNNGGKLYAWGYITGAGNVTVKNGGKVYECFQIRDWRGGSAVSTMMQSWNTRDYEVFPSSQYYVQNIEVAMTLECGAEEYAYTSLIASSMFADSLIPFIGPEAMFRIGTNGSIVKDYLEDEDRLRVDIYGDLTMSSLVISANSVNVNSAELVLPIANNLCIVVNNGTTTISQDMAMLPGSELVIEKDATVKLYKIVDGTQQFVDIFVYDWDDWKGKRFLYPGGADVWPLPFVGSKVGQTSTKPNSRPTTGTPTTGDAMIPDAKIVVKGTLDAGGGYLYTTSGGANITGVDGGKIIVGAIGNSTVTYQYVQEPLEGDVGYREVPIAPAWLRNATTTYTEYVPTKTHGAKTYVYGSDGIWHVNGCAGFSETNTATCTEAGTYTAMCTCYSTCNCHGKVEDAPALGHSWGAWTNDHTTHTSACGREGCEACVTFLLEYRLDSYTWLNATVTVPDGLTVTLAEEKDAGYTFKLISGKYYLVRQIHAKEIPTAFTATLTVGGKPLELLNIGFAAYKAILDDNTKTSQATKDLLAAMVAYGEAAYIYFTPAEKDAYDNSNVTPPALNMTGAPTSSKKDNATEGNETIATNSAKVYFDEAVRMSVFFTPSDALYNNANIVQIGLLLGSSGDLYTSNCEDAYVIYSNLTGVTIKPGSNYPVDIDELKPGVGSYLEKPGLDEKGRWEVCFDLGVETYAKVFELRPYVVVKDGDTTYCVYGEQVHYSLATYVSRTYKNTGSKAYKNLLSAMWDYVVAADAAY